MYKEIPHEGSLSRREVLKWAGKRTGEAFALGIGIPVLVNIKPFLTTVAEAKTPQIAEPPKEKKNVIEVKHFSEHIVFVSNELFHYDSDASIAELFAGFIGANMMIGSLTMGRLISRLDRQIATLTAIPARVIDVASTMMFASQMQDPRFKEYGFDKFWLEKNVMTPENPTVEDIKNANYLDMPVLLAASWMAPAIGRGYLGMSPFIAKHNLTFASVIAKGLSLGDSIKDLINKGNGPEEIAQFLDDTLAKAQPKAVTP